MWRWILMLALVARLAAGGPVAQPGPTVEVKDAVQVSVLLYHHLDPAARGENGAVVSVAEFEVQMAWLAAQGYTAITTTELAAWLAGKAMLPERSVLITFDDGYESNYLHAYPVLARYGMKAAIFMVGSLAGRTEGDLTYLSWMQMAELERSGVVELQGHTYDGHFQVGGVAALKAWTPSEVAADMARLWQGFALGGLRAPSAFAYPYGEYDTEVLTVLKQQGVQTAYTVEAGYVKPGDSPLELKRWVIYPGTSECRFAEIVTGTARAACR